MYRGTATSGFLPTLSLHRAGSCECVRTNSQLKRVHMGIGIDLTGLTDIDVRVPKGPSTSELCNGATSVCHKAPPVLDRRLEAVPALHDMASDRTCVLL